jgi:hypothetical protein
VVRLPVSGRTIGLRPPTGADEVALLGAAADTPAALDLAARLGGDQGWAALTPTDLDAYLLHVRRRALGDRVRADAACPAAGCGERIDIGFAVADYLASRRPEPPAEAEPDEPGWFRLSADGVRFRLVSVADQLEVEGLPDPAAELARRCVRADAGIGQGVMERVAAELERLAPDMSGPVSGRCPECGTVVEAFFDPRTYCLAELRSLARFVLRDVDAIARRYHWPEDAILALPSARRSAYAELARHPGARE